MLYLIENNNLIGIHNGGQSVSDEDRRPVPHHLLHGTENVLEKTQSTEVRTVPGSSCGSPAFSDIDRDSMGRKLVSEMKVCLGLKATTWVVRT